MENTSKLRKFKKLLLKAEKIKKKCFLSFNRIQQNIKHYITTYRQIRNNDNV